MKGFKCDKCGKWFEDNPANQQHHEWMFPDTDLYGMSVSATVRLTEFSNSDGQDLCLKCFLNCLEQFIKVAYEHLKEDRKRDREAKNEEAR